MTSHTPEAREGRRITWIGIWVNIGLIGAKLIAGVFGHSQALIADAVHSMSDLFTDAVVLFGLKVGRKEADQNHHFGHARIETLASTVVGFALIGVAVYLGIDSSLNIYHHSTYHPNWLATVAAAVSILAKEVLYRYTVAVGRRINSMAVCANAWHHRSDALSSVAVLLGVVGAQLNPDWHILDAYAALVVSLLVLKVGIDIIWSTVKEFTDVAPRPEVIERIQACARAVPGVEGVHDLKVRLTGGQYQMEIHVVVDGNLTVTRGHAVAKAVERCLFEEVDRTGRVIVHVDPDRRS